MAHDTLWPSPGASTGSPDHPIDGIPTDIAELNRRASVWLDQRVHAVASRTTGEQPAVRLGVERSFLASLPRGRFDTDYVETRRVHNIVPLISVGGSRYSVPTNVLGQKVEIRRSVGSNRFEVRWAGKTVITHTLVAETGVEVWYPAHRRQAETTAMADKPAQPVLRLIIDSVEEEPGRLEVGDGFDVEPPDLAVRYPHDIDDEGGVIA